MAAAALRVAVAGASGLVGRALLGQLTADANIGSVLALVRNTSVLSGLPAVVTARQVNYQTLGRSDALPPLDWAFCCLGTTIQVAGSQAAFRTVDFDAVLAFASAARAAGASRFALVSAMGADARSSVFYNRVKGEVEDALAAQAWPHLVIARPSLLLGERSTLGQPGRPMEQLAQRLLPSLGWLLPRSVRPIRGDAVAAALLRATAASSGGLTRLDSGALQALADG